MRDKEDDTPSHLGKQAWIVIFITSLTLKQLQKIQTHYHVTIIHTKMVVNVVCRYYCCREKFAAEQDSFFCMRLFLLSLPTTAETMRPPGAAGPIFHLVHTCSV